MVVRPPRASALALITISLAVTAAAAPASTAAALTPPTTVITARADPPNGWVPITDPASGTSVILTRHADAALTNAVRASGLTDREALAGLTRLVTIDDTGRRARRRIPRTTLPEPLRAALQVFIDRE
jgi:ABC-type transport system substrate-binding protein